MFQKFLTEKNEEAARLAAMPKGKPPNYTTIQALTIRHDSGGGYTCCCTITIERLEDIRQRRRQD